MEVGMVSERWARGLARSILLLLEQRQGHPGVRITVGMASERGKREACPTILLLRGRRQGHPRVGIGHVLRRSNKLGYRLGGQSAATTRSGVLEVYGRGLRRLFAPRELCGIDLKGFGFWRWVSGGLWALGREARATFWALGWLWALGAIGRRRRGLRARYFERCLLRAF